MQSIFTTIRTAQPKLASFFFIPKRNIMLPLCLLFAVLSLTAFKQAAAQTIGDYQSINSGSWETAANWQEYTSGGWATAAVAPSSTDGVITIKSPNHIQINANITVDQLIVEAGSQLAAFNATVTLNNGTGDDLVNSGTILWGVSATLNVTSGARITGSSMQADGSVTNNGIIDNQLLIWGSGAQTISGTGSIATLGTPNSLGVNLAGDQTITSLMNFANGNVFTGANKLIIASTATVQNNSATQCYVVGNLQMNFPAGSGNKTFRVGDASGYRPVDLTVNGASGTGGIIISNTGAHHPQMSASGLIPSKALNSYWTFTNAGATFSSVSATFNWNAADVDPGATPALFKVGKYDVGTNWSYPAFSNPTATSIRASGITSSSDFAIGEAACTVTIPDAIFKAYLVGNASINTNGDTEIQCTEAAAYTGSIDVHAMGITSLTGIEAFTAIQILTCYNNSLTALNVSANTNLTYLSCFQNQLSSLNLSANTHLTSLLIGYNPMTTIDLTANTSLSFLAADNGQFTTLNLSANTSLTNINLASNPSLTSLNIKNGVNSSLSFFDVKSSPLLTCIQVDNAAYMNANWSTGKDATATYSTICPLPAPAASLKFDGVDDKVKVTNSGIDLANKSFSVEMWLKRNSTNTYDVAFAQGDPGGTPASNTALHIGFTDAGTFIFNFYDNDLTLPVTQDANWHHWACTFDNVTKKKIVYRDGVLLGQGISTSSFLGFSGVTDLYIGGCFLWRQQL